MIAHDWYTELNHIALAAGEAADLPGPGAAGGFDGDGWVWIWTNQLEESQRVATVVYRASPDSFDRGVQNEVLAAASLREPKLSWGIRVWAEYLSRQEVEESQEAALENLRETLETQLSKAMKQATSAAENLESDHQNHEEVISRVKDLFLS
jgi:hypothetical protein